MNLSTERIATALSDRYRIIRELGEGGMATVYLAEDLKHDRKVAVKVLRQELAAVLGAERFIQEIKTTANLQHPHILPLFDSGQTGGGTEGQTDSFLYYVMPYIEGETLRQKLDRETQLGIDEAVRITREVADALDYAHRHGVIHRDIKPENILLHDGRPVVADFGIALAVSAAASGRMTETGLSLGTPHYMSPEQATAEKDITARSDIYSLGSVLFEMLAGEPPHMGNSAQQIIMKIIADEARAVTDLRKSVPPHVAAAVAKSLEKLPADRFASAAEFSAALAEPGFSHRATVSPAPTAARQAGRNWLRPAHAALTAVLLLLVVWLAVNRRVAEHRPVIRAMLADSLPPLATGVAISPDGSLIALSMTVEDKFGLYLRRTDELEYRLIPGTEGAVLPQFSPDGAWLAFNEVKFDGGNEFVYRKISVTGGSPVTIAEKVRQSHWGADGSIVVVRDDGMYYRESESSPERLVLEPSTLENGGFFNRPFVLPDGSGVLYDTDFNGSGSVMLLSLESGQTTTLAIEGSNARHLPTGHVIFRVPDTGAPGSDPQGAGAVMAVPFDLKSGRTTGSPQLLLDKVRAPLPGYLALDVSQEGTLLYGLAQNRGADNERLAWVDMAGAAIELPLQVDDFEDPRVSPEGRLIAYENFSLNDISLFDPVTGANTRLGFNGFFTWDNGTGLYLGNGAMLQHVTLDGGRTGAVQGIRADTLIGMSGLNPYSVSPDGAWLVAGLRTGSRGMDIVLIPLGEDSPQPIPYLQADWDEYQGDVSPDGRWLAYISQESGRSEVYIRSFPQPGPPIRVSENGGVGPVWAPDGSGLYYVSGGYMTRADLSPAQGRTVTRRTRLFQVDNFETSSGAFMENIHARRRYDIHPDGDRFLMTRSTQELFAVRAPVVIVTNWFEEVRRRMSQ